MIVPALQVTACITLVVVAARCHLKRSVQKGTYRVLIPYIVAAGILGIVLVAPFAIEIFVAHYSGSLYEIEAISFRFNGPYWWVYSAGFILPLMPMIGMLPIIGRRPFLIIFIALLAIIPVSFTPIVKLVTRVTNQAEQGGGGNSAALRASPLTLGRIS